MDEMEDQDSWEDEYLFEEMRKLRNLTHPGWNFYSNTFGGERFWELAKEFPELVMIDEIALDIYGRKVDSMIAIFTTSHDKLNALLRERNL